MICVFDIETIPDTHLLRAKFGFEENLSEKEVCERAFKEQKEKSGSEFLPIPFHRIISISSVMSDEFGRFLKVGNFGRKAKEEFLQGVKKESKGADSVSLELLDSYECGLLRDFWEFFNKKQPKLVSFNGRGFDMIALFLRAMRYNIDASGFFEQINPQLNKTKWENYRQRYSEHFHTDLLDSLGGFGAVRGLNLDTLCQMSGLVGKYDMEGAQVYRCFFESKENLQNALERIESYCQSDVLNTYWLYLKYLILKGELLLRDYAEILSDLAQKLPKEQEYYEVFNKQIQKELENLTKEL